MASAAVYLPADWLGEPAGHATRRPTAPALAAIAERLAALVARL